MAQKLDGTEPGTPPPPPPLPPHPPPHPSTPADAVPLDQCVVTRTRVGGPGGQHRNKVETAVRLVHTPTGLRAQAAERRSQAANQRVALRRLRLVLALTIRTAPPLTAPPLIDPPLTTPSPLWAGRVHAKRIAVSADHADFPALLAEALDVIARHHADLPPAAVALGVSPSQLVKLLKNHPPAMTRVNTDRAARGLPPMR